MPNPDGSPTPEELAALQPKPIGVPPAPDKPSYEQPATMEPSLRPSTLPRPIMVPDSTAQANKIGGRLADAQNSQAGVETIKNPILKVLARVSDVAGTALFPSIAAQIPGTELHHRMQIAQLQNQYNQAQQGQEREAQTAHTQAETERLGLPEPVSPEQEAYNYAKGQPGQNPATAYETVKGAGKAEGKGTIEKTDQGYFQIAPDGTATPITVGGKLLMPPAEREPQPTEYTDWRKANPEAPVSEYAKIHPAAQAEFRVSSGNEGSWQLDEDKQGHPVLFNPKTGETKAAPANLQAKGTYAKSQGPVDAALKYANDYMATGAFTGPSDEALQEKFFELAKPSTGFRMTTPQIQQLKDSASWMNSAAGKIYHGLHGVWFSPTQRKEIVATMNQLVSSKESAAGGGETSSASGGHIIKWTKDASGNPVPAQ